MIKAGGTVASLFQRSALTLAPLFETLQRSFSETSETDRCNAVSAEKVSVTAITARIQPGFGRICLRFDNARLNREDRCVSLEQ